MDFNLYEASVKGAQRIGESAADASASLYACYENQTNWKLPNTNKHAFNILDEANLSIEHGNNEEATHHLKRGQFFAEQNLPPGNRYEKASKAGIKAIKEGKSPEDISWDMDKAFLRLNSYPQESFEIPSNVEFSRGFKYDLQLKAEKVCQNILGNNAVEEIKTGNRYSLETRLKRCQYIAKKYIYGEDRYEKASIKTLRDLKEGQLSRTLLEHLEPFIEPEK